MAAYNCKVVVAGAWPDLVSMVLSETSEPPAFSEEWFDAPDSVRKEFLAIALAAKTSGLTVNVSVVDHSTNPHEHGHIDEIYLA